MARAKVEQVQCDRCKRIELLPVREEEGEKEPTFRARLHTRDAEGKPKTFDLQFDDLCARCTKTLENYWESISEWERDGKPLVGQEPEKAAPLQPPPNYTPPRPHSAAAGKK